MAGLQDLLLLEVRRRIAADDCFIAHPGEPVEPDPRQSAKTPDRLGPEILDIDVGIDRRADYVEFADHFAGLAAGFSRYRTERKPYIETGNVAREQQIAVGGIDVENRLRGKLFDIFLQQAFGGSGIAADLDRGHPGHQHIETHIALINGLRRDLHGRQIAFAAQNRRCPVTDVADHRYRHFLSDISGIGCVERSGIDRDQSGEFDVLQSEPQVGKVRSGERAGGSFDIAIDRQYLGLPLERFVNDAALDFFPGRRSNRRLSPGRQAC